MCRDVLTRVPWPKQKPHIYTGGGNQEPEDWFRFQFCSVELCNPWTYPFSLLALFPLHMLKSCVEALMRICFVTAKCSTEPEINSPLLFLGSCEHWWSHRPWEAPVTSKSRPLGIFCLLCVRTVVSCLFCHIKCWSLTKGNQLSNKNGMASWGSDALQIMDYVNYK